LKRNQKIPHRTLKKTEEAKTFVGGETQWLQRNLRAADAAAVSLSLSASKMDLYK